MGTGPYTLEAFEAHGRGEKAKLGPQHTRAGGFPRRARPLDPGYELDHPAWQRFSRPASGRDEGGAAHAGQSRGQRDAPFDATGDRHDSEPGWAVGDQHRTGKPGCLGRAELQSRIRMGTTGLGSLPAASLPGDRYGSGVVSRYRSRPLFWRLGRQTALKRLGYDYRLLVIEDSEHTYDATHKSLENFTP